MADEPFNPHDFVTNHITLEEVLEIKKAFDLFDRDHGGSIDPKCTSKIIIELK